MKTPAFVFDSYETLLTSPGWSKRKERDPALKRLEEEWKAAGRPAKHLYLDAGENAIESGLAPAKAFPEARYVLERLSKRGRLIVYSSNRRSAIKAMLRQAGLDDLFPNELQIIPAVVLENIPKENPGAFMLLEEYCDKIGCQIATYADDTLNIVKAASSRIRATYHIDRRSGLTVPRQDDGYKTISSLDQMLELR